MLKIPRMVADSGLKLQLISICGRNEKLKSRLERMQPGFPMRVEGFTAEIPYFMHLSDFFIGKPGPGSISEAIQQGLPVIVVNNTWTMPQERYNARWVSETRTGIVLDSFKDIRAGVDQVIARLPELRARVARIENRAIFEIPEILDRLLHADQFASAHLRDLPRARGLREPYRQTGAPIR